MDSTLESAALSPLERRAIERGVEVLLERLGDELQAVWLYGSRARGESTGPDSDIDLMVVVSDDSYAVEDLARTTMLSVAWDEGLGLGPVSTQVMSLEHLRGRREIDSFYIREVDRDKVVLYERSGA